MRRSAKHPLHVRARVMGCITGVPKSSPPIDSSIASNSVPLRFALFYATGGGRGDELIVTLLTAVVIMPKCGLSDDGRIVCRSYSAGAPILMPMFQKGEEIDS